LRAVEGREARFRLIEVYHCPKCSRLLKCEGAVTVAGEDLPLFQCESCVVKRAVFGPGTEEFEMAYTFCVDSAGRCFAPSEDLDEQAGGGGVT